MALYIKYNEETKYGRTPEGRWFEWHVGEPVPTDLFGRAVEFRADGDELQIFIDAMKGKPLKKVQYRIWYTLPAQFGTTKQIMPTGIVRRTKQAAREWIDANPSFDGVWQFKEEEAREN